MLHQLWDALNGNLYYLKGNKSNNNKCSGTLPSLEWQVYQILTKVYFKSCENAIEVGGE